VIIDRALAGATPVKDLAQSTGLLFQDPEWMFATLQVEDGGRLRTEMVCQPPEEIARRVTDSLEYVGLALCAKTWSGLYPAARSRSWSGCRPGDADTADRPG
jgi:energy-coupling factor transporter ATP-binding protein EcfA2